MCDNNWDNIDARVVCAQLHYLPQGITDLHVFGLILDEPCTDALALSRAAFGQGNGSTLERIYCSGSECRVTDCPIRDYYPDFRCNHAGARCCKR